MNIKLKTVIIVPTYNERDNIGTLIDSLQREFPGIPHEMHVLVVDDNSPDGTADVVRDRQREHANVHLITGDKAGLGAAYMRGMRHAVDELAADAVFEMDADFSHKPSDVRRLLAALEQGADFVIGSRYVKGGAIPEEWGVFRRLNSFFGNVVARYGAGLRQVRDCTAGFRAIRTDLIRRVDLDDLEAQGYAFQVDLLNRALLLGARVAEVPVEFVDRERGESKLGLSDIIEFFSIAARIRLRRSATFLKFCVVGSTGVVVNLGVFTALLYAGVGKYLASPIAIETSIISNFLFNNYWTFGKRRTKSRFRTKGLRFNLVSLVALSISYTTFILLSNLFPAVTPQIHQLISIFPAMAVNYLLNSGWTFKEAHKKRVRKSDPEQVQRMGKPLKGAAPGNTGF